MTTSGGKTGRTPGSRLVLQADDPPIKEALPPLTYHLSRQVQPVCDLLVAKAAGRHQDELGTHY